MTTAQTIPETPSAQPEPVDLVDRIDTEANEAIALLHMLKVFCHLEERDMKAGDELRGTLGDAAEGLAVLMGDLADRVASIKDKATKLYDGGAR